MKIGLCSLNQAWEDYRKNTYNVLEACKISKNEGVDLIIFPELTLTGFSLNREIHTPKEIHRGDEFFLSAAKFNDLNLIYGIASNFEKNIYNSVKLLSKTGSIEGVGYKSHMFSFAGENKIFTSAKNESCIEFNNSVLSLSVCYDLRFPELYRKTAGRTDIYINIANWPKVRIDHWRSLLKARAIENQAYFIGVNRTGTDGAGLEYVESSLIYDPLGRKLEPCESIGYIHFYEIDNSMPKFIRAQYPFLEDIKL